MKQIVQEVHPQNVHVHVGQNMRNIAGDRQLIPLERESLKEWLHGDERLLLASVSRTAFGVRARNTKRADSYGSNAAQQGCVTMEMQEEETSRNSLSRAGGMIEDDDSIFTENPVIIFDGMCFQFSGTLEYGKRTDAVVATDELGGFTPSGDSLTKLVNYLVVGNLEKAAPRRKGHGSKILKAIKLNRDFQCAIQIIRERDFAIAVVSAFHNLGTTAEPILEGRFTYRALLSKLSRTNNSTNHSDILK